MHRGARAHAARGSPDAHRTHHGVRAHRAAVRFTRASGSQRSPRSETGHLELQATSTERRLVISTTSMSSAKVRALQDLLRRRIGAVSWITGVVSGGAHVWNARAASSSCSPFPLSSRYDRSTVGDLRRVAGGDSAASVERVFSPPSTRAWFRGAFVYAKRCFGRFDETISRSKRPLHESSSRALRAQTTLSRSRGEFHFTATLGRDP